jgi:hypothetical protein
MHRLCLVATLAAPCLAVAQPLEDPVDDPQPDVEIVEVTPPPLAPRGRSGYRLFGFLRLKGGVIRDDPNVAFVGRNDGFVLQNARIGVLGHWGDRIGFVISADGAVDERVGANATSGLLRFALKDAYLDLAIVPALGVRVVRFQPLFDLEEIVPYTERAFIDRSLESRGVLATQGFETAGLSPGRSIGVALRSERLVALGPAALGYELAITNGNGEYESQNDNDSLAYSAALLATWGESIVFVAGRQKTRTVGELPFRQTEQDWAGAVGARVRLGPVELAGQGIARHTRFPTTGGPAENSAGGHLQASFAFELGRARIAPGYRFAIYDPSDLIAADLVQEHTAGVTLELLRVPVRLQLNGTLAVEEDQRALTNDRVEAALEVSL